MKGPDPWITDEAPALVPPRRPPPTAVGLAMLPPPVPPRAPLAMQRARPGIRLLFGMTGLGFIAAGYALIGVSVLLIPVSAGCVWLGAEAVILSATGRKHRGLIRAF